MSQEPSNALAHARSSYLRSAQHQPIQWNEWGADAFARAQQQNKPVLLDIGAVWCHWCHVMDRESYEDATLASLINERFIAVKVDRDERPDVDSRYQAAVQAISGQGGWPLTAVLTPDGRPFFGGTYFPRHDRFGRPGLERVLLAMSDAWQARREEVLESAGSVIAAIEHGESFAGRGGSLSAGIIDKLVGSAVQQFDRRYGGFGAQPKFPHPAAIDLLLDVAVRQHDETAANVVRVTLLKMAQGGIYDQVAGGFHRYSVDERWVVPHFEKMLYDNAGLLKNYVHAFQSFAGSADASEFARITRETIAWMDAWLSDRERGGFYASQDADMSLDDDGDYFTWKRAEAEAVLTPEELELAGDFYDIGELGDMHHNPAKNVLHRNGTIQEFAQSRGREVSEVEAILESARRKLEAARRNRPTPYVDRTIYTGWNAMAISAYLEAGEVLHLSESKAFALKTLDRILAEAWSAEAGLQHVVAYAEAEGHPAVRVPGMLEDYALLLHAVLDAWERTAERRYYEVAESLASEMLLRFYDTSGGGFFDSGVNGNEPQIGALSARRKPLQDTPTPAGNPVAAWGLLRLAALNGRDEYRERAEDTLEAFGGVVGHFGIFAGTFGLALQAFLQPHAQIAVIGDGDSADALEAAALAGYSVSKSVLRFRPEQVTEEALPPMLAETLTHLLGLHEGKSFAVVCRGMQCSAPVTDPEALVAALVR